ncbi:MAG TPA: DUF1329 domain-containing protein [Rhodocyclaceae bacterium]|nr:DUF1329 domain-containing protein [Rhodocyclaceae bacterium]
MKKNQSTSLRAALVAALLTASPFVFAAVSADEAAKLKSELTPFGAEKAGNKDGSIPAWSGGNTVVPAGYKAGGKRSDPFAAEKPLYSVTGANMDKYGDKLTDGVKAMLKKYPSYRIDVYPTHRTAAAPQYVYDNTLKNATRAKLEGIVVKGAIGGIPFPIPKTGEEIMWNHMLNWRGETAKEEIRAYLVTSDGKKVMTVEGTTIKQMPYYAKDASLDKFNGDYWLVRLLNSGPPIRAGEAIVGRENLDPDKTQAWVYLTGQRRVRKLPNACCDTPTPATAGVLSFDELNVFASAETLKRFDWKIVGKKEMLIPYNSNRSNLVKDAELVGDHHLNPDHVRWELHRVWVVEAALKAGQRHQAPKSRYYIDEDTWAAVLGDRWDANGQLWKTVWQLPVAMPDVPATTPVSFGFYDLVTGTWFVNDVVNEKGAPYAVIPKVSDSSFTPDAMAGEGVR